MKTTTRRGAWRQVAPGTYMKNIGSYGEVKYGATVRVSFVPFQTCDILDGNGAHVAIPTPADQKKFIAAAKKVYTKDTKAELARLQKRSAARTAPVPRTPKPPHNRASTIGTGAITKLTQAQRLEAEIKTLRGHLAIIGARSSPEKSLINAKIRTRQAAVRNLLPKKYKTAKQFAAAIRKTYEEEASTERKPFTEEYDERRDVTLRAIGRAYME
jgi:hypothetical protein